MKTRVDVLSYSYVASQLISFTGIKMTLQNEINGITLGLVAIVCTYVESQTGELNESK